MASEESQAFYIFLILETFIITGYTFNFNTYSNDTLSIFLENSLSIERYSLSPVKLGSKYPLRGTIT